MNREAALAILDLPREQAEQAILRLWEKAEQWDRLPTPDAEPSPDPSTPSGMTPVYLKPTPHKRRKKPGRKLGHAGVCRRPPEVVQAAEDHRLTTCPDCGGTLGESIRPQTRIVEDIPQVTPRVTAHTIHGYWCGRCKKLVTPTVTAALPRATLGLRLIVYTAWLHYCVGVSIGNCVKNAAVSLGFPVSPGGLTLAWKNLATLLEGQYDAIGQIIRHSAVLHADETGWRINGVTFWLWAFATREYCYYLIDRQRSAAVVKQVLGALFPGILITDFWGAYHAIQALAKQRCYFHLFTELIKVDKRSHSPEWQRFRKLLSRFLKDAVRLGEQRHELSTETYARRKRRLELRLNSLIATPFDDADAKRLIKRLKRHQSELLTFLNHEQVSPYNNHAEQQMRMPVLTRKVSQQNRSDDGARAQAMLMSLFRSAELQKLNPVEHVLQLAKAAIAGKPRAASHAQPLKQAA